MSVQSPTCVASSAASVRVAMLASIWAHVLMAGISARTCTAVVLFSTHTNVGMVTTVAPEPCKLGFQRIVPVGRTIASRAASIRTRGSTVVSATGNGSPTSMNRIGCVRWYSRITSPGASVRQSERYQYPSFSA